MDGNTQKRARYRKTLPRRPRKPRGDLADWRQYRHIIDSYSAITGITPSENISVATNEQYVYFTDRLAGVQDVAKILADTDINIGGRHTLATELLSALASIPRDEHNQLAYMIDGKISNFCPNEDGGFTYVDLFPAFIRQQNSRLLKPSYSHLSDERNTQFDSFITGDMYGVVGKFMGTLARNHPEIYAEFQAQKSQSVAALPDDVRDYASFLLEDNNRFVSMLYEYSNDEATFSQIDTILHAQKVY